MNESQHPKVPLLIASTNTHKIMELREMCRAIPGLDVLSLCEFPHFRAADEVGKTCEENAIAKAVYAATQLNYWTLGDDSGLFVPALGGSPGADSAHFAGEKATDRDHRKKLLEAMSSFTGEERAAFFECFLVLVSPKGEVVKKTQGTCEGTILEKEQGGGGFGYDPLFVRHGYNKSFAELGATKNRISHRRKAFDKLSSLLAELGSGNISSRFNESLSL